MIQSETCRSSYSGNDVTDEFAYLFPVSAKTEMIVTLVDADDVEGTLTVDVDYTVNGVGSTDSADWTITLTTPPATGETLVIVPDIPLLQQTDFENQGGFYPQTHEDAIDRLTLISQQQQEELDRCYKVTLGSSIDPDDLVETLLAAESNAEASANAAASSASDASDSADAAAASAASIELPESPVAGDILYWNGTAWTSLAKGTAEQHLKMNAGATAPEWGKAFPASPASGDLLYFNGTAWVSLAKGTALQILQMNSGATAPEWATSSTDDMIILTYQAANNTAGGGAAATAWTKYPLSTEVVDTGNNCSMASSVIVLVAGTYRIDATCEFNITNNSKLRLRNTTAGTTLVNGTSCLASSGANGSATARLVGRFTVAASQDLELQYYVGVATGANDLGYPTNSGEDEIYGVIRITKE